VEREVLVRGGGGVAIRATVSCCGMDSAPIDSAPLDRGNDTLTIGYLRRGGRFSQLNRQWLVERAPTDDGDALQHASNRDSPR